MADANNILVWTYISAGTAYAYNPTHPYGTPFVVRNDTMHTIKVTIEACPIPTSLPITYIEDTVDCTDDLPDDDCAAVHQRHKDFFR